MQLIPSYRATHLFPYLDLLQGIGAPVDSGLRRAKLPTVLRDRPDHFLPQSPTVEFLDCMAKREGIDELSLRALYKMTLGNLSNEFFSIALRSPTLLCALERFRLMVGLEDSNVRVWISSGKDTVKLCIGNIIPMKGDKQAFEDWNQLMVLIAIVRAFTAPDWCPEEIALHTKCTIGPFARKQFPDTRFLVGSEANWIELPRKLLAHQPLVRPGTVPATQDPLGDAPGDTPETIDFAGSLKRILPAYLGDGYPSIQLMAKLTGHSVRTLQRNLRHSDLTYSGVIKQTRFEVGSRLLRQTDAKIIEIAFELGYEDPAHFTRSFSRMTGVSPSQYRKQCNLH